MWQFISPRAPWQGGFYERLIGIVKTCLHKALHKRQVNPVELQTILAEVEAVVNNRPLVYVHDDIHAEKALTPAHLLYGRKIRLYPNVEVPVAPLELSDNLELLLSFHNRLTFIINKFKHLWVTEYLTSLREKHYSCCRSDSRRPVVGEVVILGLDSTKDKWELGRVMDLVPGVDGQIREVIVLNKGQRLRKTVEKLIPLEVFPHEQPDAPLDEAEETEVIPMETTTPGEPEAEHYNAGDSQLPSLALPEERPGRPKRRAAEAARQLFKDLTEEGVI